MTRRKLHIFGIVQGVGFRPHAARTAADTGVTGTVCNKGPYVEIFIQGTLAQVDRFERLLQDRAPERSHILQVEAENVPVEPGESDFRIIHSQKVRGRILVSPDIAICPDCERELFDPEDPRYLHPFINCTACGPRLTILKGMPYDRVRTSMSRFPMCPRCEGEYTDPKSRRYHAQPVCCPDCGPHLTAFRPDQPETRKKGDAEVIRLARKTLRAGGILAVKGIGGFHLACDARSQAAVARLRRLKARPFKPFAVMVRDLETAARECEIGGAEKALTGPEKPILLLPKRADGAVTGLAAPEQSRLGIMLPYTPLHHLLFRYPDGEGMTDCLIMTSANPKGAPICRTAEEVRDSLGGLCDLVVDHDREILLRADDSVAALSRGRLSMIRRSRGYAPLPFTGPAGERGTVLGMGGELKNTFCLAKDGLYYPSPYIGDLADLRSVAALRQALTRMEDLLEFRPERVVCDLHPAYHSAEEAEELARTRGLPLHKIQHHYAHVLSCMAEHREEGPVIGAALDGTGYGEDGTVWGGEFLLADRAGYTRLGSLRPFPQAGGDLAPKEGWRPAFGLLLEAFGGAGAPGAAEAAEKLGAELGLNSRPALHVLNQMIQAGVNTVPSSSLGRFFDAASAVLGFRTASSCEGEAAMVLQHRAERWKGDIRPLQLPEVEFEGEGGLFRLPGGPVLLELADRRLNGEPADGLAWAFHRAAAEMTVRGVCLCQKKTGLRKVVLTGGVMQNLLLLEMIETALEDRGFEVLTHAMIPANDGGIALGQAWYGMKKGEQLCV